MNATHRVCVVSGASSGIGAAIARLYGRRGWRVAIAFSKNAEGAESIVDECRKLGCDAFKARADVSVDDDCRRLASCVDQRWGRADVLVNSAGITKAVDVDNLEGLDALDFQRIYAVNAVGPFQLTRAFADLLRRSDGGGVVNISSVAATLGTGSSIAYAASKGALNSLTVAMARALAPRVRVNAIAPGLVDTPWHSRGGADPERDERIARYTARAALESTVDPEDVAEAAWWLGAVARRTTGEILVVDAGLKIEKVGRDRPLRTVRTRALDHGNPL